MELLYSEAALTLHINNQCYDVMPGDIFFINPRQIHHACRKGPGEIYAVVFDLNLLKLPTENDPTNTLIEDIIHQKKQFCIKPEQNTEFYSELLPGIRKLKNSFASHGTISGPALFARKAATSTTPC